MEEQWQRKHDYNKAKAKAKAQQNAVPEDLSVDDFPVLLQQLKNNPTEFFKDSQKDINKSLLLYYLNSGYELFDQYKEYDARFTGTELNKEKIIHDIQSQKLSDEELHSQIESFHSHHSFVNAKLPACGACGLCLTERASLPVIKYNRLYLKDPHSCTLQLSDQENYCFQLEKQRHPIKIPIDASFMEKKVETW